MLRLSLIKSIMEELEKAGYCTNDLGPLYTNLYHANIFINNNNFVILRDMSAEATAPDGTRQTAVAVLVSSTKKQTWWLYGNKTLTDLSPFMGSPKTFEAVEAKLRAIVGYLAIAQEPPKATRTKLMSGGVWSEAPLARPSSGDPRPPLITVSKHVRDDLDKVYGYEFSFDFDCGRLPKHILEGSTGPPLYFVAPRLGLNDPLPLGAMTPISDRWGVFSTTAKLQFVERIDAKGQPLKETRGYTAEVDFGWSPGNPYLVEPDPGPKTRLRDTDALVARLDAVSDGRGWGSRMSLDWLLDYEQCTEQVFSAPLIRQLQNLLTHTFTGLQCGYMWTFDYNKDVFVSVDSAPCAYGLPCHLPEKHLEAWLFARGTLPTPQEASRIQAPYTRESPKKPRVPLAPKSSPGHRLSQEGR